MGERRQAQADTHEAPRDFWEQRLAEDWTETGVGYRALGRPFNTWMYRVRRGVFLREVRTLGVDLTRARVLDVGSGTGFYVQRWREAGVRDVTGSDMTGSAVARLSERHPDVAFHRLDISVDISGATGEETVGGLAPGTFDVVSAMDVLFHITDDAGYRRALHNLARLLRPGGHLVLSENFVHGAEQRGPRQVNRTLDDITTLLDEAGFAVLRRVPMLVLMNAHVDAPSWRRKAWGGALRTVTLTDATGWLAGALLFPVERWLVRSRTESPTTEIMTCRLRAGGG